MSEAEAPAPASMTPAKGRPTPKRSEAEKRRRQPYSAPSDKKAAYQQSKDRDRAARGRRMEAMRRGENWALPRKDQGPVRALARDYVDSRRSASEYYMFGVLALVVLLFIPGAAAVGGDRLRGAGPAAGDRPRELDRGRPGH